MVWCPAFSSIPIPFVVFIYLLVLCPPVSLSICLVFFLTLMWFCFSLQLVILYVCIILCGWLCSQLVSIHGLRCRRAWVQIDSSIGLQCFDVVGWAAGRVLPFWYRLTQVVPDKGPLNGCVCVCVRVRTCSIASSRQLVTIVKAVVRVGLLPGAAHR